MITRLRFLMVLLEQILLKLRGENMKKLKKGSPEAKAYMKKIREKRG